MYSHCDFWEKRTFSWTPARTCRDICCVLDFYLLFLSWSLFDTVRIFKSCSRLVADLWVYMTVALTIPYRPGKLCSFRNKSTARELVSHIAASGFWVCALFFRILALVASLVDFSTDRTGVEEHATGVVFLQYLSVCRIRYNLSYVNGLGLIAILLSWGPILPIVGFLRLIGILKGASTSILPVPQLERLFL